MTKQIYFDYAAATPTDPLVLKSMFPYFSREYGNSMSFHKMGAKAQKIVEKARKTLANIINANPSEIIFTSSATESNNLALKGITMINKDRKKHIIVSAIEHDSVLNPAGWLKTQGFEVSILPVNKNGLVDLKKLKKIIRKDTFLVSVIHGNNEIGTIQDLKKIGAICHENNILLHTDASQSFAKISIDVKRDNVDLLTASSHKIYGPKGAGLLYIRSGIPIVPLLHGGGQERNIRSSTLNVSAIVGFAKAAEICLKNKNENKKIANLRDFLIKEILKKIPNTKLNGDLKNRLPNIANITFSFIEGESLLLELDLANIYVSTGSACSSPSLKPSHVLMALGKNAEDAHGSIRFSLGRWTTKEDINYLLKVLPEIVQRLRKFSPFSVK